MAKLYTYNPATLTFEAIAVSLAERLRRVALYALLGVALCTAAVYAFSHFFETPRATFMRQQNEELHIKYALLIQRFRQTDGALTELLQRDNKVYRSIFEADVIPLSVREAGLGGVERYGLLLANPHTKIAAEATMLMDKLTKKAYIQAKSFDEITIFARQKELMMDCIPSIQPINLADQRIRISALFGYRTDPIHREELRMHEGVDFAGPIGMPVHATGNGRVTLVRYDYSDQSYGNVVDVDHGFGYKTRYAHLSEIKVKLGDVVQRGHVVALMGNTGKSTGPHLHYEVQYRGRVANPVNFFSDDLSAEEFNKFIEALSGNTAGLGTEY